MKNISENMLNHLADNLTSLAKFIKITKADFVIGFTNNSQKISYENIEYLPIIDAENFSITSNNSIKNKDNFLGAFETDIISEALIKSGFFDNAEIEIFLLNYNNFDDGKIIIKKGFISKIIFDNNKFIFEISSFAKNLENLITQNYSPNCRAKFGDAKCKIDKNNFSFTGEVTEVISNISFRDEGRNEEKFYFNYGLLEFLSGQNIGVIKEVSEFSNKTIKLKTPLPFQLNINDEYKIFAGCDKKFSTCVSKFNNALNFRGEPHLPGINKIFANI